MIIRTLLSPKKKWSNTILLSEVTNIKTIEIDHTTHKNRKIPFVLFPNTKKIERYLYTNLSENYNCLLFNNLNI